jgi:nucleotide-binding universal stress UspA family protein
MFRYALSLARQYNARIVMLHVIEPMGEMGDALIKKYLSEEMLSRARDEGVKSIIENMQQRVSLFLKEELDSLDSKFDQPIEPIVVEGLHADSILQQAEEQNADLIIMGRDPRWGSHTTRQVIRNAKIPVIVVPKGH